MCTACGNPDHFSSLPAFAAGGGSPRPVAAGTTAVAATGDQDIDGLLSGTKWNTATLTFSFPSRDFYEADYGSGEPDSFAALTGAQQSAALAALAAFEAVSALSFTRVTESSSVHADLRYARSSLPSTAWAYYPSSWPEGGDSWYRTGTYDTPVLGDYAYHTFLHETGHALGLMHGHETNVFGPMTPAHDSMEYSVMTYRSFVGDPLSGGYSNETWGYAQSLMMYDIAAVQHMYGANYGTQSGNTTYSWSTTTGEQFINGVGQGAPGGNRIFQTIWDGGGIDTYNFSNFATNLTVDLAPGAWTITSTAQLARLDYYEDNAHTAAGNIANALLYQGNTASLIENAFGGSGHDVIRGNQAANVLRGNGGNDELSGLGGNDRLYGGAGADILTGGEGADWFIFETAQEGGDTVLDFRPGLDLVALDRAGFGLSGSGSLQSAGVRFVEGSTATAVGPTVFFDNVNDLLYFDADGTGSAAASLLARVPLEALAIGTASAAVSGSFVAWSSLGAADFNRDGIDDLVWRNDAGQVKVSLLGSDGSVAQDLVQPGNTTGWQTAGLGDFDGDGDADLLWQHASSGAVVGWRMADGMLADVVRINGNTSGWAPAGVGDFDDDGTDDVLWQHSSGAVVSWLMDQGQPGQVGRFGGNTTDWRPAGVGDFDADGTDDVLWQHSGGAVVSWLVDNGVQTGIGRSNGSTLGWSAAGVGDLNNDGIDDVVWRHPSGLVYAWEMANGEFRDGGHLPSRGSEWTLAGVGYDDSRSSADLFWHHASTGALVEESVQSWAKASLQAADFLVL